MNIAKFEYLVKWHLKYCKDLPSLKNHSSVLYKKTIVTFGGYDGQNHLNSVYLYNIESNKCRVQNTIGDIPKGRNGHSSTVYENKMYLIGGWLGTGQYASDEVYELDLDEFIWKRLIIDPSIGPSNMHSADLYGSEIFLFRGGNGRVYLNDLISLNIKTKKSKFIDTVGKSPHVRANHASNIIGNCLYIFGGWSGNKRLNDLYSINLLTFIWTHIDILGKKPSPRAGTQLVKFNNLLILFGGSGTNSSYLNDLHFLDVHNKTWLTPSKIYNAENIPCERAGHSAVITDRYLYIYGGGRNSNTSLSSMHVLEIDPEPQFVLRNPVEEINISLNFFFNNSFLSDVTICLHESDNEVNFPGHKFILSLFCEKFKAMFSFEFEESYNQIIKVKYDFKHFKIILKYLYFGFIDDSIISDFNLLDFVEVMKISDEYLIEGVKDFCQVRITKLIDDSNYYLINQFASKYNADFLNNYCNWYYRHNKNSILILSVDFNLSDLSLLSDYD